MRKAFKPEEDAEDEVSRLTHVLFISSLPAIDTNDPDAVNSRIAVYFETCEQNKKKPTMSELALSLGTSQAIIKSWIIGEVAKPQQIVKILEKAVQIINATTEGYMIENKVNPVPGIFLLKNHHGYKDANNDIIKHAPHIVQEISAEELSKKYLDAPAEEKPQNLEQKE